MTVLNQAAVDIAGVTRTGLEMGAHDDAAVRTDPQVTGPFAAFLRHTGQALGLYGRTRFAAAPTEPSADEPLRRAVGNLRHSLDEFHQQLPGAVREDPDALATHGALSAQALRLADQLAHPSLRPLGELFEPTTEYARAHLAVALEAVLVHPPSQGRKVLASFMTHVAGSTFTFDPHYLSYAFFDRVRPSARQGGGLRRQVRPAADRRSSGGDLCGDTRRPDGALSAAFLRA